MKPITITLFKSKINTLILSRFGAIFKRFAATLVLFTIIASPVASFAEDLRQLINQTEQDYAIPSGLLSAIASVESGNKPYALNISGRTIFVSSKEEAVKIVRLYQDEGITNIDLGLAQINLHWHGEHFKSIEEMLEPKHNIEYAAKFLSKLYRKHGSWNKAVKHYHSPKPEYYNQYSKKVIMTWLQ